MMKLPAVALSVLALAIGLAACGGSSSASHTHAAAASTTAKSAGTASPAAGAASSASHTIAISTNSGGALMFSTDSLHAAAGKVTIDFTNKAPEAHNFTLQSPSGSVIGATPTFTGATKVLTVTLKPGTYTYYCSVPGHRQGGMQGKLIVS